MQVRNALFLTSVLFILICIGVAILVSRRISRPMEIMSEQNVRLAELKQEAEFASEAKSTFLTNTSHEMRTPLNAIIGLSELQLGQEGLDSDVRENLIKICNSGTTLLGIINDLLDISKIESGKLELINAEYDIPSLINDTVSLHVMRFGNKPIAFKLDIDAQIPARLYGDEIRIKQILNNLLSNAFKYTKFGEVEWRLTYESDGDDVWLISSVRDTGIGIREEDIGRLFDDYKQVDEKSNRTIEGTGLGLAIVKKTVMMMDGDVSVESAYGEGSTFSVRIRQKRINDLTIGADTVENLKHFRYTDSKRAADAKLRRIPLPYARVLVVDDVATNLDVSKGMMKPYGMSVYCASSGEEAVELVRNGTRYDAIFMDHMMPGMDGVEAVRIIREEIDTEYARTVPIIAFTANAISGNETMFLEHGFQDFLSKPLDIMKLDTILRRWVRNIEYEKAHGLYADTSDEASPDCAAPETSAKTGHTDTSGETPKTSTQTAAGDSGEKTPLDSNMMKALAQSDIHGLDVDAGLAQFDGDADTYIDVLASYAANTRKLLAELTDTLPTDNADPMAAYAVTLHGIKGSSRGIAAYETGKEAEALEHAATSGDKEYFDEHITRFIANTEALVTAITALVHIAGEYNGKPLKDEPDKALLGELIDACNAFSMDAADHIVNELEQFQYNRQNDLVAWLRKKADTMDFEEIAKRLSRQNESEEVS
jgi:signal transduction histidine kinase/CheY-like chemotaxis protein